MVPILNDKPQRLSRLILAAVLLGALGACSGGDGDRELLDAGGDAQVAGDAQMAGDARPAGDGSLDGATDGAAVADGSPGDATTLPDGALPDSALPDASPAVDAAQDAAGRDAGVFSPQQCAVCTRSAQPALCGATQPVEWECTVGNSEVLGKLAAACTDRGTSLPRYCCPSDFAPECTR